MTGAIIGQEAVEEALLETLATARDGPVAVVIEGEPGSGKTTLWRWLLDVAREQGAAVLASRPAAAESKLPYAALGDLLGEAYADTMPALPEPQRRALEVALLLADPGPRPPAPRAISVAALTAVRALAATRMVVIAVDDVHWIDADSARALQFAVRRLQREPVLVVYGLRSGEEAPALAESEHAAGVRRVTPAPLDEAQLHRLLRARGGVVLAQPALRRLREVTGGNPLYALEVGRVPGLRDGGPLRLPETLRLAVGGRLDGLSDPARRSLAVAAALARPERAIVEAVASGGIDEAVGAGVIEEAGGRLRFAHPLLASIAYAGAGAGERRAIHRRLADLLEQPEERASHLALATDEPDADVAAAVGAAAEAAAARGAPEAALSLAEHARRLAPDPTERRRLRLAASDHAFAAGDTDRARRLLEEALPEGGADALVRLSTLATYDGSILEARELAVRALADASGPRLTELVHRRLALAHLLLGELGDSERHTRAALDLTDGDGAARALANLACVRLLRGAPEEAEPLLEIALEREPPPGPAAIDDSPSAIAGLVLTYSGRLDEGRERFAAGLRRAQMVAGDTLTPGLLFALSELESRAGRFEEALVLADRGLDATEQTGQRTERSVLLYVRALAAAHLGREDVARPAALEGIDIAERAGHRFAIAQNSWALGALELGLGRADAAWPPLERAWSVLSACGVHGGVVPIHGDAVDAAVATGRLADAAALSRELDAFAPSPWLAAVAARCRGVVAGAEGDTARAVDDLRHAVDAQRPLNRPFDLARSLLALGVTLRRAKRRGEAGEALREAERLFADLRAAGWGARAAAEARRLGGRSAASRDEMTPTERGIAELAASGRSNRDIATELFVSVRTVEANLTRVYRKLDVRTRTQLAARMRDG